MFDFHVHTRFSDGRDSHELMIEEALKKGYTSMGFTDHFCLQPCDWAMHSIEQLLKMRESFEKAKQKYGKDIELLLGLEIDYFVGRESEIAEIITQFQPDYTIGSVHFLGTEGFDSDPKHPLYSRFTPNELYAQYFKIVKGAIKCDLFDILGHFDLIKKYETWATEDFSHTVDKLIDLILEKDILVELNTSGPDRPCKEFFPSPSILSTMAQRGVKFTVGSDSHKTEHIARNFEEGIDLFEQCGVTELYHIKPNKEKIKSSLSNFYSPQE